MHRRLAVIFVLSWLGFALSPAGLTAQSPSDLLLRLASLDVSKEAKAIKEATGLSAQQERRLQEVLSGTKTRAAEQQSELRSGRGERQALELLVQADDEINALLDCEQREAYRKYRREKRWEHLEYKRGLGEPTPRFVWSPSDARSRVAKMTSTMQLSEEQKARIEEIYTDAEPQWQTIKALPDEEQRDARTAELQFQTQDELYAVLSCSQREELRKAKQKQTLQRRQRRLSTN